MNFKSRLRVSSTVMLLVPVIILLATGAIIRRVYDPVREHAELPAAFYREIYETLAAHPERLLNEDYLAELEILTGYQGRINIYVARERTLVTSLENIPTRSSGPDSSPTIVLTDWDFRYSDGVPGEFSFFVSDPDRACGAVISAGLVVLAAVVLLLVVNGVLSVVTMAAVVRPLRSLEVAAHQIKEADLESPFVYGGSDEFQEVFSAFEQMRLRLKDSLNEQQRYEANRKQLLANIAHDLKTPITAIKGYVEGIRDGVADSPARIERYLDTIHIKSVLLDELIDRLFLFSRLDLGRERFRFERVALRTFLQDACEELEGDYPSTTIRFDESVPEIDVQADPTQLRRVITNLIDNAHKHSGNDSAVVSIRVEEMADAAVVTITDSGPGIPDDDLQRVFGSFYRGDASRSSRTEGSGLGLSIARQIMIAHGGSISGRNVDGGFEMILKLRLASEEDSHS